jgi:anti-sigma factor RsiW
MTCAEARRSLPGPDGAARDDTDVQADVLSHLAACEPCRAEADALKEVDRRLQRLAAFRLLKVPEMLVQLDDRLRPQPRPPSARVLRRVALLLSLTLLVLLAVLGALVYVRWFIKP